MSLQIVPVALILALTGCGVEEAKQRLASSPVIRTAILQVMSDQRSTENS